MGNDIDSRMKTLVSETGGKACSKFKECSVLVCSKNFVLVLDNSGSMSSCNRLENLKTTVKRWVDKLVPNTKVAIVKFGSSNVCATGSKTITKDCYIKISATDNGYAEKRILRTAIDQMGSDMGGSSMAGALQSAYAIMKDEHDYYQGQPGVVMLVTEGIQSDTPSIDSSSVWQPFQNDHIRIITLTIGNDIDSRMKTLVRETGGKAFISKDCSDGSAGAFQYASDTFIPSEVGDKAMKQITTSREVVTGAQMWNKCAATNDGKQ